MTDSNHPHFEHEPSSNSDDAILAELQAIIDGSQTSLDDAKFFAEDAQHDLESRDNEQSLLRELHDVNPELGKLLTSAVELSGLESPSMTETMETLAALYDAMTAAADEHSDAKQSILAIYDTLRIVDSVACIMTDGLAIETKKELKAKVMKLPADDLPQGTQQALYALIDTHTHDTIDLDVTNPADVMEQHLEEEADRADSEAAMAKGRKATILLEKEFKERGNYRANDPACSDLIFSLRMCIVFGGRSFISGNDMHDMQLSEQDIESIIASVESKM